MTRSPSQIESQARERVIGSIPFALDHSINGMVHARTVRSPYPHALIKGVDSSEALKIDGVITVITGEDVQARDDIDPYFGDVRADQPAIAIGKVRYAGEIVALVVAETREAADRAVQLVDVDYDELLSVLDIAQSLAPGAPAVHEEMDSNVCQRWTLRRGNLDEGWARSSRIYEHVYTTPPASHVPLEPHVAIAASSPDGLDLWSGVQAPYKARSALSKMFSLEPEQVHVHGFDIGGGFGAKTDLTIEPTVAVVAHMIGRPVRLELTRDEVFFSVCKHAARVRIRTGADEDGTLVARHVDVLWNAGAYATSSPRLAIYGAITSIGPYRIPNAQVDCVACYTNTVPAGQFRGAMCSQVSWAYESQIDEIAADLGISPWDMRRKNLLSDGESYATGEKLDHLYVKELTNEVATAVRLDQSNTPPPGKARGKGIAVILKATITPSRTEVALRLRTDDIIEILASGVEMGQGATDTMIRLTSEYLGVPIKNLRRPAPDTTVTPFDTSTSASRTTFSTSVALKEAAAEMRRRLDDLAANSLGVEPHDLRHTEGSVAAEGSPEPPASYGSILRRAGLKDLVAHGVFQSEGGLPTLDPETSQGKASVHWHQGAVGAEVEVDLGTGKIEIVRCHGASYAGRIVDPIRVRQQNEGSVIFGLGPALFEELVFDEGQIINPNMADYMIPSILDIPQELSSKSLEANDPQADLHGVGEMAVPAVAPAIANAVFDAIGVRIRDLPMTAERVLRGLVQQDEVRGDG